MDQSRDPAKQLRGLDAAIRAASKLARNSRPKVRGT
jgi:hypothetical protein